MDEPHRTEGSEPWNTKKKHAGPGAAAAAATNGAWAGKVGRELRLGSVGSCRCRRGQHTACPTLRQHACYIATGLFPCQLFNNVIRHLVILTLQDMLPLALSICAVFSFVILIPLQLPLVGWLLRRRTKQTQNLILSEALAGSKRASRRPGEAPGEDDDWEKVDAHLTGTAPNGGDASKDWTGIVGFFHPFW